MRGGDENVVAGASGVGYLWRWRGYVSGGEIIT